MSVTNPGTRGHGGRRVDGDHRLDRDGFSTVICGKCGGVVPSGAHIVCSPYGPDMHVMYCPEHCPCQGVSGP